MVVVHLTGEVDVLLAPGPEDTTALSAYREQLAPALATLGEAAATCAARTVTAQMTARSQFAMTRSGAGHWSITFEGQTRTVAHSTGLSYLAVLVRYPHKQLRVDDVERLAFGQTGAGTTAGGDFELTGIGQDTAQIELIDDEALTAYQQQVVALQARKNAGIITQEEQGTLEWVQAEIRRTTGLGGKVRTTSTLESSRQRVAQAIRRTYKTLDRELPVLAVHLRNCVKPRTTCCYEPDRPVKWIVQPFAQEL